LNFRSTLTLFALAFLFGPLQGQSQTGILYGVITDGDVEAPLGFANIGIVELGLGTVSDFEGKYRLTNIPAGAHTVQFSYLGYTTQEQVVEIEADREVQLAMTLYEGGVKLEEIVVSGQAIGQRAAINQQVRSNTIVNVISKEKLRELPDQNAAEAVGRLAGVSVYRDAGEGQQVSIRGISPRFNAITVNGERLPSTEQETRAVDLSMISSDALAGIELFKAIRPDMDGDAIGGTVNFAIKKADPGLQGTVRILGGYNNLKSDWGQFRGSVTMGDRFLEKKLGVLVSANYQRVNRSNEFLNSDYEFVGNTTSGDPIIQAATLNLGDRIEDRVRTGGSLTMDYDFNQNHSLLLNSNLGFLDRDDEQYRRRYRISDNEQRFTARQRERSTLVHTNSLSGSHKLKKWSIDWRSSYSSSKQETGRSLRAQFWELAATNGIPENNTLEVLPSVFKNNLNNTSLRDVSLQTDLVEENRLTANMDLRYDLKIGKVNGYVKSGVKYRRVSRGRDLSERFMRPYLDGVENPGRSFPNLFALKSGNQILLGNFLGNYTNPDFFGGQFDNLPGTAEIRNSTTTILGEGIDIGAYNALFGTNYALGESLNYDGHIDQQKIAAFYDRFADFSFVNQAVDLEDYDGLESVYSAYLMTELNLTDKIMLMGGVRFEDTQQEYSSRSGSPVDEDEGGSGFLELVDVNASSGYNEVLPMVHVRYKPSDWMDVRLAVTKSLARPNFFNLVPWERIDNSGQAISRGKPDLKHTTAWNYDAFLSFYNDYGLFTVGGFYKELDNIDYIRSFSLLDGSNYRGYSVSEPANVEATSTTRGVELDLQLNLRSLGGFWQGIVLGANLTLARSETFYPQFEVNTEFVPEPPFFVTTVLDTFRSASIVGQADVIANLAIGYERGRFSGRISATHQTRTLSPGNAGIGRSGSGVGRIPELDFFDDAYWRFDLALKQKLDKLGKWTVLINANNLTNTPERALLGVANLLQEEEFFGWTGEFGVLYKFGR